MKLLLENVFYKKSKILVLLLLMLSILFIDSSLYSLNILLDQSKTEGVELDCDEFFQISNFILIFILI